ncbi:MAG: TrbI/VirB10 family protein [Arcobacteraceae bacterium]
MNKRQYIGILLILLVIIGVIVSIYWYNNDSTSSDDGILFTKKIPDAHRPKIPTIKEEVKPQENPPPQEEQEQHNKSFNYADLMKANFLRNEVEVELKKINRERLDQNYETNNNDIKKHPEYEIPSTEPKHAKNKNIDQINYADNFGKNVKKVSASLPVKLQRTITADKMFSAILITAVSSHLGGKVTAMIEDTVYGSHGRIPLIPKGSTAIGTYVPLDDINIQRLAINWERIITPNGINIDISSSISADIMGRSGLVGELDKKYLERYGLAFALSSAQNLLGYWATQNTKVNETDDKTTFRNEIIRDYKNDVSSLSNQALKDQIKIKPVMNLYAGQRIFISPLIDIWFPDPIKNEIQTKPYKEQL